MIEYSQQHGDLTCDHRNTIIDIIIEDIICKNIVLRPHDFTNILQGICLVFPHETHMQLMYC